MLGKWTMNIFRLKFLPLSEFLFSETLCSRNDFVAIAAEGGTALQAGFWRGGRGRSCCRSTWRRWSLASKARSGAVRGYFFVSRLRWYQFSGEFQRCIFSFQTSSKADKIGKLSLTCRNLWFLLSFNTILNFSLIKSFSIYTATIYFFFIYSNGLNYFLLLSVAN